MSGSVHTPHCTKEARLMGTRNNGKSRTEKDAIIAIGERPIPSEGEIIDHFPKIPKDDLIQCISKLVEFQLVKKVYLYSKDQFADLTLSAGPTTRNKLGGKGGGGYYAYQITEHGQAALKASFASKARDAAPSIAWKAFEKPTVALVGVLALSAIGVISARFGCATGNNAAPAVQDNEQPKDATPKAKIPQTPR
jgi:hypothetical protein